MASDASVEIAPIPFTVTISELSLFFEYSYTLVMITCEMLNSQIDFTGRPPVGLFFQQLSSI
jgi:hypothetical protein